MPQLNRDDLANGRQGQYHVPVVCICYIMRSFCRRLQCESFYGYRKINNEDSVRIGDECPWSFLSIPLAVRRSEDNLIKVEVGCFAAQARVGFAVANGYDSALRIAGETERRAEIRFGE